MKKTALSIVFALANLPTHVLAEPCATNSYDIPFPGAIDVQWRYADVPTPRHPSQWQEGQLGGYPFKIFPDGQAVVLSHLSRPAWKIEMVCDIEARNCEYLSAGPAPERAHGVAREIAQCLIGGSIESEEPTQTPAEEPSNDAPQNSGDCEATSIPDGGTVISLQRLLLIAGTNPGPTDGFIGPATIKALGTVLDGITQDTDLEEALDLLRKHICARP